MNFIRKNLYCRLDLIDRLIKSDDYLNSIAEATRAMIDAIEAGKKILIFGNGGSAADAQHFAAELVCKFEKNRRAIPAIALTTDTSILTAQSNDFGFDSVFFRQIEALCMPGDIVIGLTTSDVYEDGHSRNILAAFMMAREKGAKNIGLVSSRTKDLLLFIDIPIVVPSDNTARIQEVHSMIIHDLCQGVEARF